MLVDGHVKALVCHSLSEVSRPQKLIESNLAFNTYRGIKQSIECRDIISPIIYSAKTCQRVVVISLHYRVAS